MTEFMHAEKTHDESKILHLIESNSFDIIRSGITRINMKLESYYVALKAEGILIYEEESNEGLVAKDESLEVFSMCCFRGFFKCVMKFLEVFPEMLSMTSQRHRTPLLLAIIGGRTAIVKLILKKLQSLTYLRWTVDIVDLNFMGVLDYAVKVGRDEIFKHLIDSGFFDLEKLNFNGHNVLHMCAHYINLSCIAYILDINPLLLLSKSVMGGSVLHSIYIVYVTREKELLQDKDSLKYPFQSLILFYKNDPLNEARMLEHLMKKDKSLVHQKDVYGLRVGDYLCAHHLQHVKHLNLPARFTYEQHKFAPKEMASKLLYAIGGNDISTAEKILKQNFVFPYAIVSRALSMILSSELQFLFKYFLRREYMIVFVRPDFMQFFFDQALDSFPSTFIMATVADVSFLEFLVLGNHINILKQIVEFDPQILGYRPFESAQSLFHKAAYKFKRHELFKILHPLIPQTLKHWLLHSPDFTYIREPWKASLVHSDLETFEVMVDYYGIRAYTRDQLGNPLANFLACPFTKEVRSSLMKMLNAEKYLYMRGPRGETLLQFAMIADDWESVMLDLEETAFQNNQMISYVGFYDKKNIYGDHVKGEEFYEFERKMKALQIDIAGQKIEHQITRRRSIVDIEDINEEVLEGITDESKLDTLIKEFIKVKAKAKSLLSHLFTLLNLDRMHEKIVYILKRIDKKISYRFSYSTWKPHIEYENDSNIRFLVKMIEAELCHAKVATDDFLATSLTTNKLLKWPKQYFSTDNLRFLSKYLIEACKEDKEAIRKAYQYLNPELNYDAAKEDYLISQSLSNLKIVSNAEERQPEKNEKKRQRKRSTDEQDQANNHIAVAPAPSKKQQKKILRAAAKEERLNKMQQKYKSSRRPSDQSQETSSIDAESATDSIAEGSTTKVQEVEMHQNNNVESLKEEYSQMDMYDSKQEISENLKEHDPHPFSFSSAACNFEFTFRKPIPRINRSMPRKAKENLPAHDSEYEASDDDIEIIMKPFMVPDIQILKMHYGHDVYKLVQVFVRQYLHKPEAFMPKESVEVLVNLLLEYYPILPDNKSINAPFLRALLEIAYRDCSRLFLPSIEVLSELKQAMNFINSL